jgi:hypothetical protein
MKTSSMRCSFRACFRAAMVARSGKEDGDGSGTINVSLHLLGGRHVTHMFSRWLLHQRYRKVILSHGL